MNNDAISRRNSLIRIAATSMGIAVTGRIADVLAQGLAPAVVTRDAVRPKVTHGVMSGDVTGNSCVVWSRTDRSSRMIVDYALNESMRNARRVIGPAAIEVSDFTARVDLRDLTPGNKIFYRVQFEDLTNPGVFSEPVAGQFSTAPSARQNVTFAFSGDEAGQGWAGV